MDNQGPDMYNNNNGGDNKNGNNGNRGGNGGNHNGQILMTFILISLVVLFVVSLKVKVSS